jgi:hypothetical protein
VFLFFETQDKAAKLINQVDALSYAHYREVKAANLHGKSGDKADQQAEA